jgi:hypothetical protein
VLPVYLTWSDEDTSTTMTVQYHTPDLRGHPRLLRHQPRYGGSRATSHARLRRGLQESIAWAWLHHAAHAGNTYWFVAGDPTRA